MVDYICEFAAEHNLTNFPHAGHGGIAAYRQELANKCPEFSIAEAVALVVKHYRIDHRRASKITPAITSIKLEHELKTLINIPDPGEAVFAIDFTRPYQVAERLIISQSDGTTTRLTDVLLSVRDMWIQELDSLRMEGFLPCDLK